MSATILIVEDEESIQELLSYNFEAEGFAVRALDGSEDVVREVVADKPDLILLDWMLPNMSGIEICRSLRARSETRDVPIIMLTARGEEAERVRGLATGADDYVVKPFSVPELIARAKSLLRRSSPDAVADVLKAGDLSLDRRTRRVQRSGRDIELSPTEFKLLEHLMQTPGRYIPGPSCSTRSGAGMSMSMNARSMSTWAVCASPSTGRARSTRSAPCAAWAIRLMSGLARCRPEHAAARPSTKKGGPLEPPVAFSSGNPCRRSAAAPPPVTLRLIGNRCMARTYGTPSFGVLPQKQKSSELGSPIGQRQVLSDSIRMVTRSPSGMSATRIGTGSGIGSGLMLATGFKALLPAVR
jgi:two-component system phosphate regulon response regulator PhoB